MTANARACGISFRCRASRFAEVEIRKLAVQVLHLMQKEALIFWVELQPLPDGTWEAATPHRKV